MTAEEIIKGNKLIAEFMGGKMIVTDYHGINIIEFPDKSTKDLHGLKYNKSYDWLMPVVGKITSLEKWDDYTSVNYANTDLALALLSVNIDYVWKECIEFIKWYNSQ